MIGGPCREAGSSITGIEAAKVDSTGRRNTGIILSPKELVEDFGRCFTAERFARSCVDSMGDCVQFPGCVPTEIRALWKVLSQQAVGVFVGASLPRAWGSQK